MTTHHTSLCSVASFVCKTCHLRTCEQICSLTREGFFYFASQNDISLMLEGKNLRSCAYPYALRFVLCYPPICHPERSRSFGEAVPRQNQEPRARRDLLRPTEGYINAKNIFNHRGIGDPDTSCRPPYVGFDYANTTPWCFLRSG